jgi:serine/threonine kinase 38
MKQIKENNVKDNFLKNKISKTTKEKTELAKKYIENKYQKNFEEEREKKEYYDLIINKMKNMELNEQERNIIQNELIINEVKYLREKRIKESILDYESIEIIGRGAFGEVRLCRHKNGEIVAIKKMNKSEMYKKNQLNHIRAERDILAKSDTSWIVDLKSSFTDFNNLYLVMEYLPGGDLMNLLIEKEVFPEDMARFYIAEAILAVESVHNLNYIHRDLKPDNILIDEKGHIKLTDFGLCKPYQKNVNVDQGRCDFDEIEFSKKSGESKREKVYSMVGTVDYIAPEVFGKNGYTETVDWWSLGTILFEMLMGYPPFYGKDPTTTCKKVINYKKYFEIPKEIEVSHEAVDLLKRLITSPDKRLGKNGVDEIKAHPFFKDLDWNNIRNSIAPVIPKLKTPLDTSNFDKFEETVKWHDEFKVDQQKNKRRRDKDLFWIGYTFKKKRNLQTEEDIKNIFENLKKKKEFEGKRMFSEEKINNLKKNSVPKQNDDLAFNPKNFQYGFNFVKKKNQQKEYFENENSKKEKNFLDSNKKIFKSLVDSEKNNLNFLKNLKKKKTSKNKNELKKSCIKKEADRKKTPTLNNNINSSYTKQKLQLNLNSKVSVNTNTSSGIGSLIDKNSKLKKIQTIGTSKKVPKSGVLKNNLPQGFNIKNNINNNNFNIKELKTKDIVSLKKKSLKNSEK